MSGQVQWFYSRDGQQQGPVSPAELKQFASDGTLRQTDLIWREGFDGWRPAGQAKGLFPATVSETPVAASGGEEPIQMATAPAAPAAAPSVDPAAFQPAAAAPYAAAAAYAGFWKRFLALFLDNLILLVPVFIIAFVAGFILALGGVSEGALEGIGQLIGIVCGWLYFAFMESSAMQGTLGKKIVGIKVTDMDGNRISFGKATGRHFAKIISYITLLIGFIMAAFTAKKQAMHDMMAGTLVVDR